MYPPPSGGPRGVLSSQHGGSRAFRMRASAASERAPPVVMLRSCVAGAPTFWAVVGPWPAGRKWLAGLGLGVRRGFVSRHPPSGAVVLVAWQGGAAAVGWPTVHRLRCAVLGVAIPPARPALPWGSAAGRAGLGHWIGGSPATRRASLATARAATIRPTGFGSVG